MIKRNIYLVKISDREWGLFFEMMPPDLSDIPDHMFKKYEVEDENGFDKRNFHIAWGYLLGQMRVLSEKEIEPTPDNYETIFPDLPKYLNTSSLI